MVGRLGGAVQSTLDDVMKTTMSGSSRSDMMSPMDRFARYAWLTLFYNVAVVLWGTVVRATGSGAGCGSHWPLCNGEVVPRSPRLATLIEFGHRATSGLAVLLIAGLVVAAWRVFPRGHRVRRAAVLSAALIASEALIGAGLVLLELVAENASVARGFWVAGHLINTYLLIAALALTAWWGGSIDAPRMRMEGALRATMACTLGALLVLGASGAVTALGDTLFRASTLAEAKALTFSDSSHLFVRLRVWHPTLAVSVFVLVAFAVWRAVTVREDAVAQRLGVGVLGVYLLQLIVGAVNVGLLATVPLQLVHLLVSDFIWIGFVLLAGRVAEVPIGAARAEVPVEITLSAKEETFGRA